MHDCGGIQRVLICGWGSSTFMIDLLRALDLELPLGSEVTLFNLRVNDTVISEMLAAPADAQKPVHTSLQPWSLACLNPGPPCRATSTARSSAGSAKGAGF